MLFCTATGRAFDWRIQPMAVRLYALSKHQPCRSKSTRSLSIFVILLSAEDSDFFSVISNAWIWTQSHGIPGEGGNFAIENAVSKIISQDFDLIRPDQEIIE